MSFWNALSLSIFFTSCSLAFNVDTWNIFLVPSDLRSELQTSMRQSTFRSDRIHMSSFVGKSSVSGKYEQSNVIHSILQWSCQLLFDDLHQSISFYLHPIPLVFRGRVHFHHQNCRNNILQISFDNGVLSIEPHFYLFYKQNMSKLLLNFNIQRAQNKDYKFCKPRWV